MNDEDSIVYENVFRDYKQTVFRNFERFPRTKKGNGEEDVKTFSKLSNFPFNEYEITPGEHEKIPLVGEEEILKKFLLDKQQPNQKYKYGVSIFFKKFYFNLIQRFNSYWDY